MTHGCKQNTSVTLKTFGMPARDKCRQTHPSHWDHTYHSLYTLLCTHLNDKLVCTQIHYEHLERQGEERMTVTEGSISQQQI